MANKEKRESFFDKLINSFRKPDKQINYNLDDILSGYAPIYSNGYGKSVYASDVVQQAVYSIITELKKLDPVHERKTKDDKGFINVEGDIQRVLDAPNPLMTTSDFIEKIAWTLLLNYNAFVYPLWEKDTLKALYPLQPVLVEFDTDYNGSDQTWVRMHFRNGDCYDMPYENLIHLRYKFSSSEFMGGNEQGQPDFAPLQETLKLNETLLKGLAKSLKIQTSINGVAKIKTMASYDEQVKKVKEFEQKLQTSESGILPIDLGSEYIPITKQVQLLDATTLEFIDKKILRTFGVSIAIVDGDYNTAQYEAFYQKTLEPIVKSLSQAFTKGLFSNRAALGFNNRIVFYEKEMIFLSMEQKIKAIDILVDSASIEKNEARALLGLRRKKEYDGQIAASSNKTNADNNAGDSGLASGENTSTNTKEQLNDDDISGTDVAEVETDKVLNGAQTQSLIQTILAYKEKTLTYDQTVNIISISIGITKEEAKELLGEPAADDGENGGINNE